MVAPRVLVIEDDLELRSVIVRGLGEEGFSVSGLGSGRELLERLAKEVPDLLVLDVGLPDTDGRDVCQAVRAQGIRAPVLFLTARDALTDRLSGFSAGGDDYLSKPFAFAELVARVRALSRRAPSAPPVLRRGDLSVDRARHRASRGGCALSLTRKEFGILETLLTADGVLVSAEELLEHVWDANADPFSNIVSVTMARLRRKLGDPPLIETVVGKGYRM
jgi:DNA-binding response OmpR family regulator